MNDTGNQEAVNDHTPEPQALNLHKAYPMLSEHTISDEHITIPDAATEIAKKLYSEDVLESEEFKLFPIRHEKKGYFKYRRQAGMPRRAASSLKRNYLKDYDIETLRKAYRIQKEIRELLREAIDGERIRFYVHTDECGLIPLKDKYFMLKKIDFILSTGLIRPANYKKNSRYEVFLIDASDFRRWISGVDSVARQISNRKVANILEAINRIPQDGEYKITCDVFFEVFKEVCRPHFEISENRIQKDIWAHIDKQLKINGPPGKDKSKFERGKAEVREILEIELGLKPNTSDQPDVSDSTGGSVKNAQGQRQGKSTDNPQT